MMPPLVVILLTSTRTQYAIATIEGLHKNLVYNGTWLWYVAADHSNKEHFDTVVKAVKDTMIDCHNLQLGYGASVNLAVGKLGDTHPVTLLVEDDWLLSTPLDVTPYVKLLMEREDVGMVRLGHMPINLELESVGYNGHMYLDVKKTRQYAFSGNPHLKHKRFYEQYGLYPTGLNPGETEITYDGIIRGKGGSRIVWPLAIGDRFLFGHIGQERSY